MVEIEKGDTSNWLLSVENFPVYTGGSTFCRFSCYSNGHEVLNIDSIVFEL